MDLCKHAVQLQLTMHRTYNMPKGSNMNFGSLSYVAPMLYALRYAVNDNSFEGEKFRGYWVRQVCREKFCSFLQQHLQTLMVFQLYTSDSSKQLPAFQRKLCFLHELSLKTVHHQRREYITDVCADFTLSRMTMQEKSYS